MSASESNSEKQYSAKVVNDLLRKKEAKISILELKHELKDYMTNKFEDINEKIHKIDMHIKLGYLLFAGIFSALGYIITLLFKILAHT